MKKFLVLIIVHLVALMLIFLISKGRQPSQETITFFPIDPSASYETAATHLSLKQKNSRKQYRLGWKAGSILNQTAFLRQDISLLFSNGRLFGELGNWKQNTDQIMLNKTVSGKESSLFEAITFHYSEIHRDQNQIFSAQILTNDFLYVIHSGGLPARSFRVPADQEEKEWKSVLDETKRDQLSQQWSKAIQTYAIEKERYHLLVLNELVFNIKQPLPGFTQRETERIIGNLWEGLYKNYYLGIKKRDGSIADPIGSAMPLIMLAKDKTHLLIMTEAADGEPIMLRQRISTAR